MSKIAFIVVKQYTQFFFFRTTLISRAREYICLFLYVGVFIISCRVLWKVLNTVSISYLAFEKKYIPEM